MSNPIEERINGGENALVAFLTEATCGEACWEAREDVCRCSCGGRNHGCMRTADGSRPVRTAKIDGYRYELKAVGDGVLDAAHKINESHGVRFHYASTSRERCYANLPAKVRTATDSQMNWPELAAYKAEGQFCTDPDTDAKHYVNKPYLLWVRTEIRDGERFGW